MFLSERLLGIALVGGTSGAVSSLPSRKKSRLSLNPILAISDLTHQRKLTTKVKVNYKPTPSNVSCPRHLGTSVTQSSIPMVVAHRRGPDRAEIRLAPI